MCTNVINDANVLTPDLSTSVSAESAQVEKPPAVGSQSQSSSSGSGSLNPGSSTASTVPVSPVLQSPAPPLLQDPILLRQLLPALQTALQLNSTSVDMAKINEGEFTSVRVQRAPASVTKKKKIQSIHRFTDDGTTVLFCLFVQFSPLLSHKRHYSQCSTRSSPPGRRLSTSLLSCLKLLNSPTKVNPKIVHWVSNGGFRSVLFVRLKTASNIFHLAVLD